MLGFAAAFNNIAWKFNLTQSNISLLTFIPFGEIHIKHCSSCFLQFFPTFFYINFPLLTGFSFTIIKFFFINNFQMLQDELKEVKIKEETTTKNLEDQCKRLTDELETLQSSLKWVFKAYFLESFFSIYFLNVYFIRYSKYKIEKKTIK